ncbi:hypothetical protein ACS0TY_005105 [Phlomoides rotata]
MCDVCMTSERNTCRQAGLIKNMAQAGKWKSATKVNCHYMIQVEEKYGDDKGSTSWENGVVALMPTPDLENQKKTSIYQAQDSESHCDHLDGDPSLAPRPGMKRKRAAQVHKLSEKRRRHKKINKRLRALQDLIPNCTKMDKASVLDDAIEYLKSLQYQLQIMSIFAGLPTQMMLPTYYPPGSAIAMRLGMVARCNALQCFTSPFLGYGTPSVMSLVRRSAQ